MEEWYLTAWGGCNLTPNVYEQDLQGLCKNEDLKRLSDGPLHRDPRFAAPVSERAASSALDTWRL